MSKVKTLLSLLILYYFRFWARRQLKRINSKVIGVTGSVGKSTTCCAIYAILNSRFKIHYSEHANSESGISLDILGLTPKDYSLGDWSRLILLAPIALFKPKPDWEIYLAEMGIDSPNWPKNMDFLLSIFENKIDIGVFLNARLVHSQNFKNLEEIAAEKKKLVEHAIHKIIVEGGEIEKMNTKDVQWESPDFILPDEVKTNLLAAMAVAKILGIRETEALAALQKNFRLPPGRLSKIAGINGSTILDSSYNASRSAVLAALKVLKVFPAKRKIAVLGDMRELGKFAATEHREVAREALRIADAVFTVGPLTKKYFPAKIKNFTSSYEAGLFLKDFIQKDDVILVKGSQNTIFLETAVEMLMAHPEDAEKLLCRRGEFWDKKRINCPLDKLPVLPHNVWCIR
jgi:UDP-N-acetylmuramoyl-tripeptide--D-alanyl-D-alanine ligase